jgi:hypothetical protein
MFGKIFSTLAVRYHVLVCNLFYQTFIQFLKFDFFSVPFLVCNNKFYNLNQFQKHIETHEYMPTFKCIKCQTFTHKSNFMHHLKSCYGFGNLNCAFCKFGDDHIENLKSHLSQNHCNRMPLFFDRSHHNFSTNILVRKK